MQNSIKQVGRNQSVAEHILKEAAQRKRRKDALHSAVISTVWMLLAALLLIGLRWYYQIKGFLGIMILLAAMLELGAVIPVWILLKERLQEIEGGEEDVAAQY